MVWVEVGMMGAGVPDKRVLDVGGHNRIVDMQEEQEDSRLVWASDIEDKPIYCSLVPKSYSHHISSIS